MVPFPKRLEVFFDSLATTPAKFATEHKLGRASLFNMIAGRSRPNLNMLERICAVEPRASAEWLIRGEGEPLRDQQLATVKTTIEELKQIKAGLEKRIEELGG